MEFYVYAVDDEPEVGYGELGIRERINGAEYKKLDKFPRDLAIRLTDVQLIAFSIEKWEAIRNALDYYLFVHDGGIRTCALCAKYHRARINRYWYETEKPPCVGCPIAIHSKPLCQGTPYQGYSRLREPGPLAHKSADEEISYLREVMLWMKELPSR